jgi:hypothetical protein
VFRSLGHWLIPPLRVTKWVFCSYSALSSPQYCGNLNEEHEGYTLRALNNIARPNGSLTFLLWPPAMDCYLSTNESWLSLCVHHWPQSFHHYKELALFSLCPLQNKPLASSLKLCREDCRACQVYYGLLWIECIVD